MVLFYSYITEWKFYLVYLRLFYCDMFLKKLSRSLVDRLGNNVMKHQRKKVKSPLIKCQIKNNHLVLFFIEPFSRSFGIFLCFVFLKSRFLPCLQFLNLLTAILHYYLKLHFSSCQYWKNSVWKMHDVTISKLRFFLVLISL